MFSKKNKVVIENYLFEVKDVGTYALPNDYGTLTLSYVNKKEADYLLASPNEGYISLNSITWPLIIRNRRSGDSFIPLGQKEYVKVKKCLINKKIQREKRSEIPFVMDREKGIIFVAGIGIDNPGEIKWRRV